MGRDVSTKVNRNSKSSVELPPPASDASYSEDELNKLLPSASFKVFI